MKENSIRRAVREGRAALGTGLKEFASRGVPWIIEASGFDYCMIDHEHGAFDLETIADLAGWFQATDVSAIVRIHKSFTHMIPAILDQGIMGIQVSEVDSVEEARAIVAEAKYPPIGNRGISGQGMHTGYRSYGARHATEYAPWANANIIVCVSIESLEGLENVEAIAAVEGIDMIAYGHSDLSARLRRSSPARAPDVQGRRAPDSGGLQRARQTCPRVGGNRGADRGVLAARVQGAEPARQRRQHLSRWPEGACRSRPCAAEIHRCSDA